jgi:hypothetical protein
MAADRRSPIAIRQWLVRLGHLCFDDFQTVTPETLDLGLWTPDLASDWSLALNNAPSVQLHFRRSANLQSAICNLQSVHPHPCLSPSSIASAQARLVSAFALELLKAKAPPLYDSLPWHNWDFSIVAKRFKLWQTRFLLIGDGTTVTMCRCRKSAGVYVLEPCESIARYVERKAVLEKVRRFRLLRTGASSPSPQSLIPIPLPDHSVDLAILGSCPSLDTGHWQLVTREMLRVSRNILLIENSPLSPPFAEMPLTDAGFRPDSVAVSGLGQRRCWWRTAASSSPA